MSTYNENFRLAAVAAAKAWTQASYAIDNAHFAESDATRARRAARSAALASLDATKFSDRAYLEGCDESVRDTAASAHCAYTLALRAADAAEKLA